jgi:hypothetical protein
VASSSRASAPAVSSDSSDLPDPEELDPDDLDQLDPQALDELTRPDS